MRADDDSEQIVLEEQDPGTTHIGAGGYTKTGRLQRQVGRHCSEPRRPPERWLQLTGQEVNVENSMVWTLGGHMAAPVFAR